MEVILLEKTGRLGNIGDRINVKAGYGRNYLIPQGKAVFATPGNIARLACCSTLLNCYYPKFNTQT